MLFLAVILSSLHLLFVNRMARRGLRSAGLIVGTSLAFLIAPCFLGIFLGPVMLQALLMCGVIAWILSRRDTAQFLGLSCGAALIAWGVSGVNVWKSGREDARLRALYPYESMEARLSPQRGFPSVEPLPVATVERLDRLEKKFSERRDSLRARMLFKLHEDTVGLFINSPGFGVARMFRPNEWSLASGLRRGPSPAQPGARVSSTWSPGDWRVPAAVDDAPLGLLLEKSIEDFVHPQGFGYFKDRRRVAGFEGHRFRSVPGPAAGWNLQTLELVSLLLHDPPEVYDSDHLPRMDRLRGVPTRPLDAFEQFGLEALHRGEDLFLAEDSDRLRVLGAVRSVERCLDCHGGNRGDLLGAFSYTLLQDASLVGSSSDSRSTARIVR